LLGLLIHYLELIYELYEKLEQKYWHWKVDRYRQKLAEARLWKEWDRYVHFEERLKKQKWQDAEKDKYEREHMIIPPEWMRDMMRTSTVEEIKNDPRYATYHEIFGKSRFFPPWPEWMKDKNVEEIQKDPRHKYWLELLNR
ncbi:MAG: hypothetical protein IMZ61_03420, partial [Planctomycetes bacterium]|nr:hypothetical protein [Planctomycetota bacterium]